MTEFSQRLPRKRRWGGRPAGKVSGRCIHYYFEFDAVGNNFLPVHSDYCRSLLPVPVTFAVKLREANNASNTFGGKFIQFDTRRFIFVDVSYHRRRPRRSHESGNDVDRPW